MRRRPTPSTTTLPNSLVASAARITSARLRSRAQADRQGWQAEAWSFYDSIGELRYASEWIGRALSRARLVPASVPTNGDNPAKMDGNDPCRALCQDVLNAFGGGITGQAQLLHRLGIHLSVPGDSYLVGMDEVDEAGQPTGEQSWVVRSTEEVTSRGSEIVVDDGESTALLSDDALLLRVWNPHPRKHWEADSPVRAVLPVLREIEQLGQHIGATVDSRLAGAGLLLLPNEVTFARGADAAEDNGDDVFTADLIEAMVTPIKDRDSAAAVVPLVLKMPGEHVDKVRHLTFGTDFDARVQGLREEAIRRLALGLNLPPEILLGQADSNAWTAWQIEESGIKLHLEPLLTLICDAITEGYYRPALRAAGVAEPDLYCIWFDTSELQLRPNRAPEAQALFDRFAIDFTALRDASGFDDSDAPSVDELKAMVLLASAKGGSLSAELANVLFGKAPILEVGVSGQSAGTATTTDEQAGLPEAAPGGFPGQSPKAADPTPTKALPQTQGKVPDAQATPSLQASAGVVPSQRPASEPERRNLLDAAEVLVLRALERAGNKRRSRADAAAMSAVPEFETHLHLTVSHGDVGRLLAGAWTLSDAVADRFEIDAEALRITLAAYVTELLIGGVAHNRVALARYLGELRHEDQ